MKSNIYFTLLGLGFAFFLFSCKKDKNNTSPKIETPEKIASAPELGNLSYDFVYRPVLFDFTSTGCPGCGSWGKPTFKNLIAQYDNLIVPIAVHIKYGDPMITNISEAIADNRYESFYTPQLWVSDSIAMVLVNNNINSAASIDRANLLINRPSKTTGASIAAKMTIKENKAFIKYGISLNAEFEAGNYFLSAYLMENGLSFNQASSSSNPTIHDNVIKAAADGTWGKSIIKKENESLTKEFLHTFEKSINSNQYITILLWKESGNRYQVINAISAKN